MAHRAFPSASGSSTVRQTRRRTSPEDQAILEAAYRNDPKPDKAARAELAHRVSLNEKEISIWYQNKRQVSRRRSRPLATDDIIPTSSFSQESTASTEPHCDASSQEQPSSQTSTAATLSGSDVNSLLLEASAVNKSKDHDTAVSQREIQTQQPGSIQPLPNSLEVQRSQDPSKVDAVYDNAALPKLKITKHAKKPRDSSFTLFDESQAKAAVQIPKLPASLKRTISQPRLCTSLDGSVRIKTGLSPSPSPPRLSSSLNVRQPRLSGPLQRSQSAIVTPTIPDSRSLASVGRSRDSRTWEFYCDSSAKDELTLQAEREQKGSAAGAIGLIRSRSKGSLGATNGNKRTATCIKPEAKKRMKTTEISKSEKPKLARASSSVARLQNSNAPISKTPSIEKFQAATTSLPKKHPKKKLSSIDIFADGNESDKENWVPGTQASATPRRRTHVTGARSRVLHENTLLSTTSTSLSSQSGNRGGGNLRRGGSYVGKENDEPEMEREIATFMRGGNVVAGEDGSDEDLNCVQGLLSLSQGAWR
ncbi:MAG: hypothetical protein Q9219_000783 [cf. Caloplaca sp. 3 TL-2023]